MDQITQRIHDSFARQSLMATFGAALGPVTAGAVTIRAPILPLALQQAGFGHGGLVFSLGDSAAGYSALSMLPPEQEVVTAEMKINFLGPAKGDELIARGKVIRNGKRLVVVTAEVSARTAENETPIAIVQGTMVPVPT
ncbi:PaaI family thioesterase [Primorskyibacter marinus]|uniref:PaaI family thioesterase n=1 Tax=Primorskyibacter marinus TaxID=1977320 RepID=UPI000E300B4A|nr:PaaI family thioesterase [Primorskyibacter marinus]